jgi:sulfite reductase (ferredoxin)
MIKYKLPENIYDEIDTLEGYLNDFTIGKIDKTSVKAHRVPFGVYEQRTKDTYMLRLRCPGGIITPHQLRIAAQEARKYGRNILHITTRQEIQIHDLPVERLAPVMRELAKAGLSSRGGGGNTVRNITSSFNSGVRTDEVFDVEPHVLFLTDHLIADSASWNLPRKYKISFSNAADDTSFASVQDLGFIAEIRNSKRGFRVFTAGGLGSKPSLGKLLYDFIAEDEILEVAIAVRNVFNKYGNRKNRNSARLKFLWEKLGEDKFREAVNHERESLKGNLPGFELRKIENVNSVSPNISEIIDNDESYNNWKKLYVREQKQGGYYSVKVPVKLGDLKNDAALALADFLEIIGENTIRFTLDQNIVLRNIPASDLGSAYKFLKSESLVPVHSMQGNIVSCTGASTCQLGICLSRGAATALSAGLEKKGEILDNTGDINIKISGCPNACGQHWAADLGFYGTALRKGNRVYPAYHVVAGSSASIDGFKLAQKAGDVSAKDLPAFVNEVLADYSKQNGDKISFRDYLASGGFERISSILNDKYSDIPEFDEDKNYYFDWDADEVFSLTKRSAGECSAGIFDFIERDQKNIKAATENLEGAVVSGKISVLSDILFYSARMLLVTRGIEGSEKSIVFSEFRKHFIGAGLVSAVFESLLIREENGSISINDKDEVLGFSEAVLALYDSMDDSLNFKSAEIPEKNEKADEPGKGNRHFKDLRGVACPMNFVKTKAELSKLAAGEILEIFLDDGKPVENVPGSVKGEGHSVLSQEKTGDFWKVIIRKA